MSVNVVAVLFNLPPAYYDEKSLGGGVARGGFFQLGLAALASLDFFSTTSHDTRRPSHSMYCHELSMRELLQNLHT